MDLRVLSYFLAVAREGNITNAATTLHLTQPTLSRQLKDLERELGKPLFVRGKRKITLTEEGLILRKRAEELIDLASKTKREIIDSNDQIQGDIYIGAGETQYVHYITKATKALRTMYPRLYIHISSGDSHDNMYQLDNGCIDFTLVFTSVDPTRYNFIKIPAYDIWGVLMLKTDPLAKKRSIKAEDLQGYPLIMPRVREPAKYLLDYLGLEEDSMNIVGTYSLAYNASIMVRDELGYAITIDGIINTGNDSDFCFIPFHPTLHAEMCIAWKKYQYLSKPQELFLQALKKEILSTETTNESPNT